MFNLKFRKNTTRDLIMEKLDKDALLSAIQDLIDGRTSYLTEESVGCVEVADKWNELLDHIITEKRQEALNTNQLLGEVIRMDSMRSMLSSVGTQTDSLHIMASNSEELSASIQDVTNIIQETANFANNTHKDTQMGVKSTEELIDFVINSFEEIKEVNVELQQVKERTSEIIRIIDIVQGIAEQTNLLSLNAAIEAARAGENGRGFAVVAEEVRKLAEHTKESVEQVQEDILKLQRAIDLSVNQMDSISSKLDSGKSSIEETLSIINNIGNSVERIDDAVTQIAANSEEQAASTETFAEAIENVSYEADFLSRNCRDTGLAIFNISKSIERVRSDVIKNKAFLKQEDMIETYKIDHLLWRWRVYNMLLGFENVDGNAVGNYKGCNLGCWYYSEDSAKCKDLKAFKDMEEVHILLHEVAKKAVDAFNKGDILTSEENLNKMDEYSRIIFEHLDEIKNNIISSGE